MIAIILNILLLQQINIVSHNNDIKSLFIDTARDNLLSFLHTNKEHSKFIPIGHNVHFDIQFIKHSGLLSESDYSYYISHIPLDTLHIASFLKLSGHIPQTQLLNLVSLCKYLHITIPNNNLKSVNFEPHNAEYDATITVELLKAFKKFIDIDNIQHINKKIKL